MKIAISIDKDRAVLAGKSTWGRQVVEIETLQLTQEEREILVRAGNGKALQPGFWHAGGWNTNTDYALDKIVISSSTADLDAVKEAIQGVVKQQAEYTGKAEEEKIKQDKEQAEQEVRNAAYLASPQSYIVLGSTYAHGQMGNVSLRAGGGLISITGDALKLAQKIAADCEKEQEVRKAEQEAGKKRQRDEYISAWIAKYGTPSQQERYHTDVLPNEELMDAIREQVFAPLADLLGRYKKIQTSDIDHDDACGEDPGMSCDIEDLCTYSDEEWELRKKILALMPGAVITLRLHDCECKQCNETAQRRGLLVVVSTPVGDLTREFAI